jgi:hypothetical protein
MVVQAVAFLLPVATAEESQLAGSDIDSIGKREAVRTVVAELLSVGIEEYNKSLFDVAYDTFLKAQNYKKYLTDAEQSKLSKYLKAAKDFAAGRREAVEHIRSADKLIRAGQLIRAKAHLKAVEGSKLLTIKEKGVVKSGLKKIAGWLVEQEKQMRQIYNRSVVLYDSGQLENARAGFIKVAKSGLLALPDSKTAEDYIHKIDASIGKSDNSFTPTDLSLFESESKAGSGGWSDDGGILSRKDKTNINQNFFLAGTKRADLAALAAASKEKSVAQGYTQAVVKDAIVKAKDYIKNSNFYQAQKSIDTARKVLNENRSFLDESTFNQYDSSLKKLEDDVSAARKKWLGPLGGNDSLQQ